MRFLLKNRTILSSDERNGNYTRIMNDLPNKSGDIYLSKGSFQDGWVFAYTLISSKIMLRIR